LAIGAGSILIFNVPPDASSTAAIHSASIQISYRRKRLEANKSGFLRHVVNIDCLFCLSSEGVHCISANMDELILRQTAAALVQMIVYICCLFKGEAAVFV